MDKKVTGILSYLGVLWLIGYFAGDKEGAKFHLNQGLVLLIAEVVLSVVAFVSGILSAVVPVVGLILSLVICVAEVAVFVFIVMGIIAVCKDQEKALPLIGKIQLLK